jgi:hypothetical protein
MKIIGVFQDHGDERFINRLNEVSEQKKKAEKDAIDQASAAAAVRDAEAARDSIAAGITVQPNAER